jgi:DNA-binding response OmpR family regulator
VSNDVMRRVLIVEDEAMIAMLVEDMLTVLGYEVAGIAYRLEDALGAARAADIDLAILDVNLSGEASFPVAEILRERGVPFIFATGYGTAGHKGDFGDALVLKKPFNVKGLAQALSSAATRRT